MFQNYHQHDWSEFAKVFLDQLEVEFKKDQKENFIDNFFTGRLIQQIKWNTWESVSQTKQNYVDISLNLNLKEELMTDNNDIPSVIDLLYNHFLPEKLWIENDNEYFWANWDSKVESAWLTQKLSSDLPPVIMVTLNRSYYDKTTASFKKKKDPIALSYSISIKKEFIYDESGSEEIKVAETELTEDQEINYDLYAVIIHSGTSTHSGHYYTIAKDNINDTEKPVWRSYNDSIVTEVESEFIPSKMKYDTPYILFYHMRGKPMRFLSDTFNPIPRVPIIDKFGEPAIPENLKKFIDTDNER